MTGKVHLTPLMAEDLERCWIMLQQFRKYNFDDYGPQTFDAFKSDMLTRVQDQNQTLAAIRLDDLLVGFIGLHQYSPTVAGLKGICVDRKYHGTGVARAALDLLLSACWQADNSKVQAAYFADNMRVRKFLKRLGAEDEGYLRAQTVRDGKPLDVRLVAFFQPVAAVSDNVPRGAVAVLQEV